MPDKEIASAPTLSIVVPVYNEAAYVAKVLEQVKQCGYQCQIIVVDDGSTDATGEELLAVDGITLIQHDRNQGK